MAKPPIYDFGMHNADDTAIYLRKGFRVVAIEADPGLCDRARERFPSEIANGDLTIVNKAIGTRCGTLPFYVCNEDDGISTASPEVVRKKIEQRGVSFREIPVEFVSADQILAEYGPGRYAKIDIEGHDLICLQQIAQGSVGTDFLSFELDRTQYRGALDACLAMGFVRFVLVDQAKVTGTMAPNPSCEGASILHRYEPGESGPFGHDLAAEWISADEMAARCLAIRCAGFANGLTRRAAKMVGAERLAVRLQARLLPAAQTWYDIHASREAAPNGQALAQWLERGTASNVV